MKRIVYFLFFLLLSVNILIGQDIIQIDPVRTSKTTLALSDMIESIEYIPLETGDKCLIGDVFPYNIIFSTNYILISSNEFYLFNRAGKFITQVGRVGQGPGEYYGIAWPLTIDEVNQRILITHNPGSQDGKERRLIFYDLKGKHIQTISIDVRLGAIFRAKSDDKYVMMHLNNPVREGIPPFDYSIFSADFKLITEKIKHVDYTIQPDYSLGSITIPGDERFCYYLYNSKLHVRGPLNDTVYSISQNLSFVPKYVLNAGRYVVTKQMLSDAALFKSLIQDRVFLTTVFETDSHVLISYRFNNKDNYFLYDKKKHGSVLFNSEAGIPNDYDGGMDFWPKYQNGNEFITWYNAYLFDDNKNRLQPKGSKIAIDKYNKMRKAIDSESNPVLVIVKMKSL